MNNKGTYQSGHLLCYFLSFSGNYHLNLNLLHAHIQFSKYSIVVSLAEQTGLNLTWSQTPMTCFLVTGPICCVDIDIDSCSYCKSGKFRENFIFANSVKRHICDVKNLQLGHDFSKTTY